MKKECACVYNTCLDKNITLNSSLSTSVHGYSKTLVVTEGVRIVKDPKHSNTHKGINAKDERINFLYLHIPGNIKHPSPHRRSI